MALDPITAGIDAVSTIIDKVFPDKGKAEEAKAALLSARELNDVKLALAQIGVNQADAQSSRPFQAFWRPALAWVCLLDVAYETIIYPVFQSYINIHVGSALSITMPILMTLIGARSFDKYNAIDTK